MPEAPGVLVMLGTTAAEAEEADAAPEAPVTADDPETPAAPLAVEDGETPGIKGRAPGMPPAPGSANVPTANDSTKAMTAISTPAV